MSVRWLVPIAVKVNMEDLSGESGRICTRGLILSSHSTDSVPLKV